MINLHRIKLILVASIVLVLPVRAQHHHAHPPNYEENWSNASHLPPREQKTWLEKVLKNNPRKWSIVSFHHPIYSASARRDNALLRNEWKPLFDRYGVDLVLQGHDHSYARGRARPYGENVLEGLNARDYTGTIASEYHPLQGSSAGSTVSKDP